MARVTLIAFALLTGFFYVTGKPVNESGQEISRFASPANHKVIAEQALHRNISNQLISTDITSPTSKRATRKERATGPQLPSRNPRRVASRSSKYAKSTPAPQTKTIQLAAADTSSSQTFHQGRNKFSGGIVKPLGQSYQQKYVKSQKPVLGPRLTAVLVKRELRRIGCYSGNVTSNWDDSARAAITFYNTSTGSSLATKTPLVSSLEHLQQITKTACVEQPVVEGTIIASAGQRKSEPNTKTVRRVSKWRTNVRVRKATFRTTSTARPPRYEITRPRLVENYIAPPEFQPRPVTKPRKVRRTKRVRRLKRVRIAKRNARRRTAVRSWRKRYRRKRFGFSNNGGNFSLNN